jgi:DNA polymerase elongation subunit (family B)
MAVRRLFYDIEVAPNLVLAWRTGYKIDLNYDGIVKERAIITIAWKWEGEKKVHCLTWDENQNDRQMLEEFMPVLAEADEAVAHYGDRFDLPWIKTRCLFYGIPSLPLYKTIDTKQLASKPLLIQLQ